MREIVSSDKLKIATPQGHFVTIEPQIFNAVVKITRARWYGPGDDINVAESDFDSGFADEVFEYPTLEAAWAAVLEWDGESDMPDGWTRARCGDEREWRRRPDGDARREFRRE